MPEQFLWFYASAAQMSFVLLGFWWAVVTLKREEWFPDPVRLRIAYCITLHFIVTGVASLVSLLSGESSAIWRVGFGIGGVVGLIASLLVWQDVERQTRGRRRPTIAYGWWVLALVYVVITAVAVGGTPLIRQLGSDVKAIQIEGVLVGLLLFVGAQLAWSMFVESWRDSAVR